jgi:menaquinone-9 beta-reductase
MSEPRVVVVGGGPAGLATAIALRRHGVEALVLERRRPPIDKACGEGIMPDGVAVLRRLGAVPPGMPFGGIRYCDEDNVADAPFPGPPGLGVRRTALHAALAGAAAAAGVTVRWDTRVEAVTAAGEVHLASPKSAVIEADWVVAADGLRSPLRAMLGLAGSAAGRPRFGVRRHYRLAPWTDRVEVHWRTGVEAYVTPVAADEVGVAMLWGGGGGFDALLARFPQLETRLAGAERASRDRGAGPFRQRTRGVVRGRVALVGDAAGYLDALTGEGLGLAFGQAEALAAAIAGGDLGPYAAACRRLVRLADGFTHLLLFCERRPRLRRRVVRELGRRPELFSRLLGAHARQIPARAVGARAVAHLLFGLLRG